MNLIVSFKHAPVFIGIAELFRAANQPTNPLMSGSKFATKSFNASL